MYSSSHFRLLWTILLLVLLRQAEGSCRTANQGELIIEASHIGEIDAFDIVVAAIGFGPDTLDIYHVPGNNSLSPQSVTYQACFQSHTLYGYAVFYNNNGDAFSYGEYQLFVNGRQIVNGNTSIYNDKSTEFYFYGDEEDCPTGEVRFTLTIQFDPIASGISWKLESLDDDPSALVLDSKETIFPLGPTYNSDFDNDSLFVDRCILPNVRYRFTIEDTFDDGLEYPGYEITSNGVVLKQGGKFRGSESIDFVNSAVDVIPSAPNATGNGNEVCNSTNREGKFSINATYQGERGTFDIATTAIGLDPDAPDMYHLTSLGDSLSEGATHQGCFQRNTLYRYVVSLGGPDCFCCSFSGEYQLVVNDRQIVDETFPLCHGTFTEFYFYGDEEVCPAGEVRFTLTIQFNIYVADIS